MAAYRQCMIKSFKYNGSLHRMWVRNWQIPAELLISEHAAESMLVLINNQTQVREADGRSWISKVPAVSFFIPGQWFNVVALLENGGIRYYCNIASPPYFHGGVLTYIDYDLDVIVFPDGSAHVVDRDEYEAHTTAYQYPAVVQSNVSEALLALTERIREGQPPFDDRAVRHYYDTWKNDEIGV